MSKLKQKLESAMKQAPELDKLKDQVQMTVTGEGLRIELMESDSQHVLRKRQRAAHRSRQGDADHLAVPARQNAQPAARSRATPMRSPTFPRPAIRIGNFPRTAPMRPAN